MHAISLFGNGSSAGPYATGWYNQNPTMSANPGRAENLKAVDPNDASASLPNQGGDADEIELSNQPADGSDADEIPDEVAGQAPLHALFGAPDAAKGKRDTAAALDEQELVAKAKAGDGEAFAKLMARYDRKVFRLARNITQNDEDAEDVLQEAFLKAYTHLDSFQGDSKFYTWIVRIAVNEGLMKLRKRKGDRTVSLDEEIDTGEEQVTREIAVWDGTPEQRYSQAELRQILDEAIQHLKPPFRMVFQLRDVEELSTEETAEALGLSIPAVKSRLLRARLQLRERLTRLFKRKGDDAFAYL